MANNVVTVGPDLYPNQGIGVPDSGNYAPQDLAPGWRLGSEEWNVVYFDLAVSVALGGSQPDDWKILLEQILVSEEDCDVEDVEWVPGDRRLIDHPELNNLPVAIRVLICDTMTKADVAVPPPTQDAAGHWYYPAGTVGAGDWYISDELKDILEVVYDWSFSPTDCSYTGDTRYHDLALSFAPSPAGGFIDGEGGQVLYVRGFGLGEYDLPSIADFNAAQIGDCADPNGIQVVLTWTVPDDGPFGPPIEYEIFRNGVSVAIIPSPATTWTDPDPDDGVQNFYTITWIDGNGITSVPATTPAGYIDDCDPNNAPEITEIETGECFTDGRDYFQGGSIGHGLVAIAFSWTPDPNLPLIDGFHLKRSDDNGLTWVIKDTLLYNPNNSPFFYDNALDNEAPDWYLTCDSPKQPQYQVVPYRILFNGNELEGVPSSIEIIEIPCCSCDDYDGSDDIDCPIDECWYDPDKDVTLWFSDYNPDIAESLAEGEPYVSFDINYCLPDNCALGLSTATIKLDLPDGRRIISVDVPEGPSIPNASVEIFDSQTYDPLNPIPLTAGDIIKITATTDPVTNLTSYPPVSSILCTVWIDELIGTNRICFDTKFDELELTWVDANSNTQTYTPETVKLGPCLSQCTGEVNMGYGDFYFEPVAVDNDTFDIKYCLTRDEIDTFIIPVLVGDFTSNIAQIENYGDWYDHGWEVKVINPVPGLSIIVGHGKDPTIKADQGFSTLLRATLNNQLVGDDCICILPFFLKLGDLFKNTFGSLDKLANLSDKSFINMSRQMSGGDQTGTPGTVDDGPNVLSFNNTATTNLVSVYENLIDQEKIDPRFRELYNCIFEALKEAYKEQRIRGPQYLQRVIIVAFLFLLIWKAWLIFADLFEHVKDALDVAQEDIDKACTNEITLPVAIDTTGDGVPDDVPDICCWDDNGETIFAVPIYYESSCSIAGAQFELKIPSSWAQPVELLTELPSGVTGGTVLCPDNDPWFLEGDAKNKGYIQAFSTESGKYLCVYDKPSKELIPEKDFILANAGNSQSDILTTILIKVPGMACMPSDKMLLVAELELDKIKIVTLDGGEIGMKEPVSSWTGNIYTSDEGDGVAKFTPDDLTATIAVAIGACSPSELNDPSLFMFSDQVGSSWDSLNPLVDFDCSYSVVADAEGNSEIDIVDVVTLRNGFAWYGFSAIGDQDNNTQASYVENIVAYSLGKKLVPRTCCPDFNLDFDVFVPDECSDFCVPLDCYGKIWIERVTKLQNGVHAIDVYYSTSCEKNSGFQFAIRGLNPKEGIYKIDTSVSQAAGNKYNLVQGLFSGDGTSSNKIYIAYAGNEESYVPESKGLLVRLLISSKALLSSAEMLRIKSSRMLAEYQGSRNVTSRARIGFTSENMVRKLYGMQAVKWRILSNSDTIIPASSWDSNNIQEEDLNYIKKLIEAGEYDPLYDAEGDEVLDVADIQTVYHAIMTDSFGNDLDSGTLLPSNCCPCVVPEQPDLEVLHYASKDEDVPEKLSARWRELFDCRGGRLRGGIILVWDNQPDANYYEIWRQRVTNDPEASKPMMVTDTNAILRSYQNFLEVAISAETQNDQKSSMYMEVGSPKTYSYVDFPATAKQVCCDPCDPTDSSGSDSGSDDEDCENDVHSMYRYWIVAYNDCGEASSKPKTGVIPCCFYNPIAYNDTYSTTMNQGIMGQFKAYHPYAHQQFNYPLGADSCEGESSDCVALVYKAPLGDSNFTAKGGKVSVGSGGDREFKYGPAENYIGVDGFRFMVCAIPSKLRTIQNSSSLRAKYDIDGTTKSDEKGSYNKNQKALKNASLNVATRMTNPLVRLPARNNKPCCDIGFIRINVLPPCPLKISAKSGACAENDYSETVEIAWSGYPIASISSYNVYRLDQTGEDWTLLENVPNVSSVVYYTYTDTEVPAPPQEPCEPGDSYNVAYAVTSVTTSGLESPNGCIEACAGVPCEEKSQSRLRCCVLARVLCCPDIPNPDIEITNLTSCPDEETEGSNKVILSWTDLPSVDEYSIWRSGPYQVGNEPTSISDYSNIGMQSNPPENGKHAFVDLVMPCKGCDTVKYSYVVMSHIDANQSTFGENVQTVFVQCCNKPPTAYDQTFTTKYDTNITKSLLAIDADSNIASYELVDEPWSGAGEIISFDNGSGSFTFDPATYFVGNTTFVWKVIDECGEYDEATVTIIVEDPDICDEDDYVICNAVIPWLTDQQDVPEIRIRIEELPQVPFLLNTKGVPSLRKRCMSYAVTCGIDPMIFGRSKDGCVMFIDTDTPTRIVAMFCDETIPFSAQCLPTFIGVPESISLDCDDEAPFSDGCKPTNVGISSVQLFCDFVIPLSHGCLPVGFSVPNITLECDPAIEFIDVCKILKLGIPEEPLFICEDGITFTDNECATNAGITEGLFFACGPAMNFTDEGCEETDCDSSDESNGEE